MELYLYVGMFTALTRHRWAKGYGDKHMELFLQFGYGMMEHCRHLIDGWGGGTAILSPRDLTNDQLNRLSTVLRALPGGNVLLDPQFYLPHADHERLCQHDYWPDNYTTNSFFDGTALNELLTSLRNCNHSLNTSAFILPGLLAMSIDDVWLETQRAILEEARVVAPNTPLIMTIALGADAARNDEQVAALLEAAERWRADAYYIVCEHPGGDYLVSDANWLANVIDLSAGLRLQGAKVILGYCNHQMLIAGCSKATAICSGTWMNVRSFPPDKFRTNYDDEIKQRSTWYYCPHALSEYKPPFLDIARRQGVLMQMQPQGPLSNPYVAPLFSGAQPSAVGFNEQAAFRHYLYCLRLQSHGSVAASFDETLNIHNALLDNAEVLLATLRSNGVTGQKRDFTDIIDVNRAALAVLSRTRAPMLRHQWNVL